MHTRRHRSDRTTHEPVRESMWLTLSGERHPPAHEAALLASARWGDEAAAGEICDRHGSALLSLACAMLLDSDAAEQVVAEAIAEVCTQHVDDVEAGRLRHNLTRRTYLRCVDLLASDRFDQPCELAQDDGTVAAMTKLREIARQQRAAVVLIMVGDHTGPEVAQLLGLTSARVVALMSSCLNELQPASDEPDDRAAPPARTRHSSWASSQPR